MKASVSSPKEGHIPVAEQEAETGADQVTSQDSALAMQAQHQALVAASAREGGLDALFRRNRALSALEAYVENALVPPPGYELVEAKQR